MNNKRVSLIATGMKFAIVVSRFNEFVSSKLLDGCYDTLVRQGAKEKDIEFVWVPGSFELSFIAKKIAQKKKVDAVICLGTIIRGDTPHFEYVSSQTARGIQQVSLETGIPVIYGVVTADSIEQAVERAGTKQGNRGRDAALGAIEMVSLAREI